MLDHGLACILRMPAPSPCSTELTSIITGGSGEAEFGLARKRSDDMAPLVAGPRSGRAF